MADLSFMNFDLFHVLQVLARTGFATITLIPYTIIPLDMSACPNPGINQLIPDKYNYLISMSVYVL